jgi:hypothetical protein
MLLTATVFLLLAPRAFSQTAITWSSIDCGGGSCSGGGYSLDGTIGQSDPGPALTGGGYSLTGGLWAAPPEPRCGSADFNHDGDIGTDADISAFFACLGGNCCPACGSADFNGDGDLGTDADIEAFFRVLAGGSC